MVATNAADALANEGCSAGAVPGHGAGHAEGAHGHMHRVVTAASHHQPLTQPGERLPGRAAGVPAAAAAACQRACLPARHPGVDKQLAPLNPGVLLSQRAAVGLSADVSCQRDQAVNRSLQCLQLQKS